MVPIKSTSVPLTPGQQMAVGRVAAEWNMAEYLLAHLLWALIPVDQETGGLLTTHLQNEARRNIVDLLAGRLPEDRKAAVLEITKEFDELRIQRNVIVHSNWAGSAEDLAHGFKPTARGSFKINSSYWSEGDMVAVADEISDWIVKTLNYMQDHLWWPAPSSGLFAQQLALADLARRSIPPQTETPQPPDEPSRR